MRKDGLAAVLFLRALLDCGLRAGVEPAEVLAAIGVSPSVLEDMNGWVAREAMAIAWDLVPAKSGDPNFGLHMGETSPPGAYGALEFATMSSRTALEALLCAVRAYALMGAMNEVTTELDGDVVRVIGRPFYRPAGGHLRHVFEHFFSLLCSRARIIASSEVGPLEVHFAHDAPEDTSEHRRIFRCPVFFGAARNELVASRAALDIPLRTANPVLSSALQETATTTFSRPGSDVERRLRHAIAASLREGDARLEIAARKMGIGSRTLQRKLKDQGVSYADLLDDVRGEVARQKVADEGATFGEIAFNLGFSQPSAFHRAFKRWTGTTPKEYRDARRARGTSGQ